MEEVWKDIIGYENSYQASNLGRIRTCEGRTTFTERHGIRKWKQRIMKGRGDNPETGKRVSLWKNGRFKEFLIARLVAFTFYGRDINNTNVDNRRDLMTVNHLDGNRMNNNLSNLEIVSLKENIRYGFCNGQYDKNKIPIHFSDEKSNILLCFDSMSEAERYFGIKHGYFWYLKNKSAKNYKSFTISYGVMVNGKWVF